MLVLALAYIANLKQAQPPSPACPVPRPNALPSPVIARCPRRTRSRARSATTRATATNNEIAALPAPQQLLSIRHSIRHALDTCAYESKTARIKEGPRSPTFARPTHVHQLRERDHEPSPAAAPASASNQQFAFGTTSGLPPPSPRTGVRCLPVTVAVDLHGSPAGQEEADRSARSA